MRVKLPFEISISELVEIVNGNILFPIGSSPEDIKSITISELSTDTREDVKGCLFIPLKGQKFDGHDFIEQASESGAVISLCETGKLRNIDFRNLKIPLVLVNDTFSSFLQIGKYVRDKLSPFVISVGGSAGKTSTKELIHFIFSSSGIKTHKSIKSFNNKVGLAISMCSLEEDTEVAVFEIGTSAKGEISELLSFADPSVSVLVSVGKEHLEGLGSEEGVFEEEFSLIKYTSERNRPFIFNAGNEKILNEVISTSGDKKVGFLGLKRKNSNSENFEDGREKYERKIRELKSEFFKNGGIILSIAEPVEVSDSFETKFSLSVSIQKDFVKDMKDNELIDFDGKKDTLPEKNSDLKENAGSFFELGEEKDSLLIRFQISTNLPPHFSENISCSISTFLSYMIIERRRTGISDIMKIDFRKFRNEKGRFSVKLLKGNILFVDDTYNSNPLSQESLFYSASFSHRRKIFVLGDMLELGELSTYEHENLGFLASKYLSKDDSIFLLLGDFSDFMKRGLEKFGFYAEKFESKNALFEKLRSIVRNGDAIFFKASRARKFEEIAEKFENSLK